jgi:flagellar biogenesis protein FliO
MTPLGWTFMFMSIGFVLGLVLFCFYRVLTKPNAANHMHAPLDIDTHDLDT